MMVIVAMGMWAPVVVGAERVWTRSEVLAITDREAQRLGYAPEHMSVLFDWLNSQRHGYLNSLTSVGGMPNLEAKLKDRKYVALYYHALKDVGDHEHLWVFIDRHTGEIIDTIPGE